MKSLVAYFTQTNNTKMIAEAIHEVLSNHHEVDVDTVRRIDFDSLGEYDLLFVGGPCHDSDIVPAVKRFLEKLPKSPKFKLAGFFTHSTNMPDGTKRNEELFTQWAGRCIPTFETVCKDKDIELLGIFHCQGKASEPLEVFIRQQIITDDDEWAVYLPEVRNHPSSNDIENAKKFAQEVLEKL